MHPAVQKYKQAWEERNPDLLVECFTHDAVYQFRPTEMENPCRGLAEIEQYWREKVILKQTDIRFEILREVRDGNQIWLEWRSVATWESSPAPDKRFRMWGVMILDLTPNQLIGKLTEYYFGHPRPAGPTPH